MTSLSSSGARIRGDDFQHAYAAARAVEVLLTGSTITHLGVEDPDPSVHNADDITVYRTDEPSEFVQAKSSVDATTPANVEWLTDRSTGGSSILSHLYDAWTNLREKEENPRLRLVSNKPIDPNDAVLTLREGTDGTVATRLRAKTPKSKAGRARASLAAHLEISEDELLTFLECLSFRFGQLQDDHRSQLATALAAAGLRSDRQAVDLCIGMVRGWVTTPKRLLTAENVREEITALGIESTTPAATVVIQAIDYRPTEGATVGLDWVVRYEGEEARNRRVPREATDWSGIFRPQLAEAVEAVRTRGDSRVHVAGAMRLPTWFAAGNAFGETAGFEVEAYQSGELWTSAGPVNDYSFQVVTESTDTGGGDVAVAVSIATDIWDDVVEHVASLPTTGSIVHFRPDGGVGPTSIADPQMARDMAVALRNDVRDLVRSLKPSRVHVFLACPGVFAMLLGHRWDRIADTQLYADLAPGYAPAYLIPN